MGDGQRCATSANVANVLTWVGASGPLVELPNMPTTTNNNNDRLTAFDPGQPG